MAHPLARVRNGFLEDPGGDETRAAAVPVGSAAWYNWLTQHRSFRFEHRRTPYTARREQRPGGWYWYASHRTKGTLHTLYLGRSEDLTLERLEAVAQRFAQAPLQPSRAEDLATGRVGMPPDLLLATKLTPPQPRPTLVSRPRLISRIQEGTRGKLTLIVAPAGYGKTTLLGAWMTSGALPVAWLSLDEGDNDSTRFWSYVVAALERRRPGFSEHLVPLIRAPQVPPMEVLLTTLINALAAIPKDVALILDDYHLIQAAPIHSAMTFLLEHLPPQVHLVLASRAEPPLALARVRAQGEVTEVHLADLRFTPDEVASFLQRGTGLALSLTQIGQLAARTEGWIAGLQLAALSMQQCDNVATFIETFAGDDRHIFDYFTEEVLQGQPEHLQAFLLQTSILDRLTGSLCDAVTGKPGSAATLRALEQANLFIVPMDTQRCWYRYHPLFADLLRHRLHQGEASLVETLHRRAAAWYAQQGLSHEAVQHALAAADFALAAHLIEELATTTLRVGLAATMLTWLEALPADLVHTRPRLGLLYAQAYLELSQFAAAEPGVRDAEAALSACSDLPADEQRTLLGRVEAIRSTIAINLGDIPGVLAHAHRALDLLSADDEQSRIEIAQVLLNLADANAAGDDPAAVQVMYAKAIALNRQAANFATTITAMSGLGRVQTLQGQLHKAAHTLREAIALATEGGRSLPWPSTGKAHIFLGALLYEWNDLDGAAHHLTQGIQLCQHWGHVYHVAEGFLFLAKVRAAQGDLQGGYARLQQAKQLVDATTLGSRQPVPIPKLRHLSERLAATQAEFLLARGELEAATRWAQRCGLSLTVTPDRSPMEHDLTLARLLVALGRPADADRVLEGLAAAMEAERWTDDAIKILVAQAATLEADGKTMQAIAVLERALQLAKPGGYVRTFLDEGVRVHRLLSLLASSDGATADYARTLLAAFSALRNDSEPRGAALADPLSEREEVVLRLLAAGLSSPEVASHLIIAVSTVRSHIKHIYAKLQVHTRAEAVRQARALRLV